MKKVINGKVYDTEKAKKLGFDSYSNTRDFNYWHEEIYRKKTGEFFLYGEGGPMTKYAISIGQNSWSGGEKIIPLSIEAARKWVEDHLDADDYEEIFGLPDEDAEPVAMNIMLPAQLMAQLRTNATERGESLTAYVTAILSEAIK